jgi:hypothetical protein
MDPNDTTAISFSDLVLENFLKFFRSRSKGRFIIRGWKYKTEAVQFEQYQQANPIFYEKLMQTCNRSKLATQAATT